MRQLFLVLILVLNTSPDWAADFSLSQSTVRVISDRFDATLPEGYFSIKGRVLSLSDTMPIPGAVVTNFSGTFAGTASEKGEFKVQFPVTETIIYAYAAGYDEVTLKGPFGSKRELTVEIGLNESAIMVFKPVIYAYQAPGWIELCLTPKGVTTFTYPTTENNCWSVTTTDDGNLISQANGKQYPYLFWEASQTGFKYGPVTNSITSGFLVKTDTCTEFLEHTLAACGLNEKETTDFITFWALN